MLLPFSGNSQPGENYFSTATGWENYYTQHPELTNPPSHEYKNYIRWRAFWDQRSQSMDSSLSGKPSLISDVINQYLNDIDYFQRSTAVASNWKPVGPMNLENQTNGLVMSVYVDTVSDKSNNTIYIGSNSGGIWKTVDGGNHWENVTDRSYLPCIGTWDIQGDPTDGNILYAGTGGNFMERGYYYGMGIIRTQDAGYSWQVIYPLPETEFTQVYKIAVDPSNPERLYAAVGTRLVRLIKNGLIWDTATIFTTPEDSTFSFDEHRMIRDIEFVPGKPDTLYIATDHMHWNGRRAQVWRLTGVSGNPVAVQLDCNFPTDTNQLYSTRFEIAVTKNNPNSVYIVGDYYPDTADRIAIWKSINNGITWTKVYDAVQNLNSAGRGGVNYFRMELLIDPVDTNKVYVGGFTVSRLENWQVAWTTPESMAGENGYHVDTRDLVILNNGHLFAGNDGGISKSTNRIQTWTDKNGTGLFLTQYWDMGSTNQKPEWIGGGTQDNSFSLFQNNQWQRTGTGDRANMGVNYESDTAFFIYNSIFGSGGMPVVTISKDGGATWGGTIHLPDGKFNPSVTMNPQRFRTVFLGGHNVYKSFSPDSSSYITIPVNINGNAGIIKSKETIGDIEIANNDSNKFYVAFNWGVYDMCCEDDSIFKLIKTNNGGTTFTAIFRRDNMNAFDSAVNLLGITDILLSPTDTSKLWVTLGGFDDPSRGTDVHNRVFYSNDGGVTFTDISAGLPNFPVNCITYWRNSNDGLFAGTDVGVYFRDASMNEWVPFNQGLPKTIVMDLEILDDEEVIRAATFGRGIYEADLSCEYVETPLVITSDTTWTEDVTMDRDIVVESPAVFTIQSEVKFPPQARIKVKPGSTLIVDGGTLTNTCFTMWQGIQAWGVTSLPQAPVSNQSLVIFTNNARVKNARIGITNCKVDENGYAVWDSVGGIIRGYNSTFTNNFKAVQFMPYRYPSYSRFYNITFETTNRLIDGVSYPFELVSLYDIHCVWFYGCTFCNTTLPTTPPLPRHMKGNGIHAIDAVFGIDRLCDDGPQSCVNPDSSIFSGLNYGICLTNSDPSHFVHIRNSKFLYNYRGMYLNGADFSEITGNRFTVKVPSGTELYDTTYGMYLGNSTGYWVEGNSFTCPGNSITPIGGGYPLPRQIGVIVDNSGGDPNEIYRNYFENLDIAINAQRVNRYDPGSGGGEGGEEEATFSGLVLKCNTYNNNSYDEMVTRESPTGVEGIARDQGSPTPTSKQDLAGNTFSPYHETVQIPETDILNDGDLIYYFHHIPQYPLPRLRPEFVDTNVVKARNKYLPFDSTCCPSRLESGGSSEDLRNAMYEEQQNIDSLGIVYIALVDGGSTDELNSTVFFSFPPDALSLHQELLTKSPYLSDTVMQTAIEKEEVLPNAMIRDILVANPQSAKSNDLLSKLNERFIPMPGPLMAEIMAGESILSAKEELESEITIHASKRKEAFYQLLRAYQNDSTLQNAQDSVIWLLQEEQSLGSAYKLAFEYLENGDTVNLSNTLNSIANNFSLSGIQEEIYNDYQEYLGVLSSLRSENKTMFEMDSGQIAVMQNIATTGQEPVCSYARNILLANQLMDYCEPILLPDSVNTSPSKPIQKLDLTIPEGYFSLYPNPTKQYLILEYNLSVITIGSSVPMCTIYDAAGKQIKQISLNKAQDQMIIPVETYSSGVYLCCLSVNGKFLQSCRFTIAK
jgi:hypothetical protein